MAEEIAGDAPSVAVSDSGESATSSDRETSGAKKPAKKVKKAKKAKKAAKRSVKRTAAEGDGSPSGDSAPAKRTKKAKKAKKTTAKRAKKTEASEAVESAPGKTESDSETEGGSSRVSYGRRPRRSGPELIQPDEQGRSSSSVVKASAVASKPAAEEADSDRSGGDEDSDGRDSQGDRRGGRRRRGRRGRSRVEGRDRPDSRGEGTRPDTSRPARSRSEGGRPDRNRSDSNRPARRPKKATSIKTPRETVESEPLTVERMVSETWTEDKARKFLSDGFLSSLSPDILDSESKNLSEAPNLEQPLRTIRRVLADECMVEDDATDVMLLDIVVKALSDWTLVYRIKAKEGALDEVERLMDIRSKADRRLMEAIAALKNS